MKLNILSRILLLLIFSLPYAPLFATTYWIAQNGSDNNPGTESMPWRTIGKANTELNPGDTVYIKAGIYSDTIHPDDNGTSETTRIVYKSYPGENVYLTSQVNLDGKKYITIDGFKMQSGTWGTSLK